MVNTFYINYFIKKPFKSLLRKVFSHFFFNLFKVKEHIHLSEVPYFLIALITAGDQYIQIRKINKYNKIFFLCNIRFIEHY